MKIIASLQFWAGLFLTALSTLVLTGWALRYAPLVQMRPNFVAMVITTATCFLLFGIAFLADALSADARRRFRLFPGLAIIAISLPLLAESLFNVSLGIDLPSLHAWLVDGNPRPGRMAPNTAIGFLLAAIALVLSRNVGSRATALAIHVATFAVLLIGLTGLVGYAIQLELLYSWFQTARMALHTAIGMMVVSLGLWGLWHREAWYVGNAHFRDDEKIAFVGAGLLVVVALTTGVAGFAAQQSTLEATLGATLTQEVHIRRDTLRSEVARSVARTRVTAQRLGDDGRGTTGVGDTDAWKAAARSMLASGASGVSMFDERGRLLLQIGSVSNAPALEVDLDPDAPATLIWDGDLRLRTHAPLRLDGGRTGRLAVEDRMPQTAAQLMRSDGLGATGEAGLCVSRESRLVCFPQFRNRRVYFATHRSPNGKPTPIGLAVSGAHGVMKGLDYRGRNVIASYVPLGLGGLGLNVKQDASELFRPIRRQLEWVLPLLLLLVASGAWLLRRQVKPLASRLLAAQQEASDKETRLRSVVGNVAEAIVTMDTEGRILSFNDAACGMFGYGEAEALGANVRMLMPPGMHELHDAGMRRYLAGGAPRVIGEKSVHLPGLHRDGSLFDLEIAVTAIMVRGHEQFVGILRDITERKRVQAALLDEKERLRVTLESIGDGVITTDTAGHVTYLNPVAEVMTGWPNAEAVGRPLPEVFHILHEHTRQPALNPVEVVLRDEVLAGLAEHTSLQRRGGGTYAIEDSAAPIRSTTGEITGVVLVFHDVSQARLMATEMTHQATHDALTGLINRREFERRLELAIQSGAVENKQHSMLYLDLDQFKVVNDTSGHMAGDELLRQLTTVMQEKLRASDTLARLGGDEFGVLLESCDTGPAMRIADLLRQAVREFHFVWQDKAFPIGVSIGVATFSNGGITIADVLRMADAACYVAKDNGRNRIHVYAEEDIDLARRHGEMGWIGRIQKSLDEGRLRLYSQKIQPLADGSDSSCHYELLLRMVDEDGAIVPPMAFIPAAERYGLMPSLDRWVVAAALADCAARIAHGEQIGTCAINLSGMSVCDEHFLGFVLGELDRHAVSADRICFEITETAAITNLSQATTLIRELKLRGCRFALDDFGSGMSSFAYLKHLPVDYLKIDGSFVKDMLTDPIDCAMVEAINNIGHVMGIQTIAEFVESEAILQKLTSMGIDYAQGYGVQRPHLLAADSHPCG